MNKKQSIKNNSEYKSWLTTIKNKAQQVQIKAAVAVSEYLLKFYWDFGLDMLEKQKNTTWGDGFIPQLSKDLMAEFPEIKGFSPRNLKYIRQWVTFWMDTPSIGLQAVAQLTKIPWGHNQIIITRCKNTQEALYYIKNTFQYGWSRGVLAHQIESSLWQREGKAVSNFSQALPSPQSDLVQQTLKDPYILDFLSLKKEHNERELEQGLEDHITKFLLEIGAGFAYIGRQIPLQVGSREFFVDLLLYHTRLHCYCVLELKTVACEPEHIGKLNFYIKAIDEQFRQKGDAPTIGLLLCKSRDKVVVEYALRDINKPIGVSEYQITKSLPDEFKSSLPTVEELEDELNNVVNP
jgi:predicted nuclease of restriction endonuclease-like (RecB) superfamily